MVERQKNKSGSYDEHDASWSGRCGLREKHRFQRA